jgi:hypothetical protein
MKILGRAGSALAGVLAGASLVGFALPALGDGGPSHRSSYGTTSSHLLRAKGFTSKSSGLKVGYVADRSTVDPSAEGGLTLKCPKKTPHAISGFFGPTAKEGVGQVVLSDSLPDPKTGRSWDIGVKNLSAAPQGFVAGAVCVR